MDDRIKVIVTAPKGAQARLIIQEILLNKEFIDKIQIVGTVGPKDRDYIGLDSGIVSGAGIEAGAKVYGDIDEIIKDCHVVVDFSTREASMEVLDACVKHKKTLIIGTTSFNDEEIKKIEDAAKTIPLLKAANTSRMVNIMAKALEQLATDLKGKCKIEIIDMHGERKVDAPSGTAKELAEKMCKSSRIDKDEITHHSVRAGDIVSTHKIIFGGMGERIEISHEGYSFRCYATGACEAVIFMAKQKAGYYEIEEVFK